MIIKKLLNLCITIEVLNLELDLDYGIGGWPWFGSINIIAINHRSLFYFDNWKSLDLFWFHVIK